jgi:hypothetical protein
MITKKQKTNYRVRYVKVLEDLTEISNMQPKERYMYRLMNTVIFQDFETALDVVIEDFKNASNDNKTA